MWSTIKHKIIPRLCKSIDIVMTDYISPCTTMMEISVWRILVLQIAPKSARHTLAKHANRMELTPWRDTHETRQDGCYC